MVNLFELCVNIIEMFITLSFLTLYFETKYSGFKRIIGFLIGLVISVTTITYLNSLYIYEGFLGLSFILIYFIYSVIFLKGDIYTKLFISGFINCIVYFISLFSTLLIAELFTHDYNTLYGMTSTRVILIILTKLLLIAVEFILLKFKIPSFANHKSMIVLIIMPVIAEMSMVGIMQVFLNNSKFHSELLLSTVSVMIANILTYYVFIKINKDAEIEKEVNAMQQKYEHDKKYAEDIEELYLKTCGIRHDLMLHLTAINDMIDKNKDEAKQYIQSILHEQLDTIKHLVKTDNDCFDAIVNAKIALCEKLGISVQTRIMNKSLNKLKNDEIAVIFGNLFDNAIEAAKNSKEKSIELDIQVQGQYLSIFMKNSVPNSILSNNKTLMTTKTDKSRHGFGTKNIKRIVNKYQGMIEWFEEKGFFCCDIYCCDII